jgi:hypothetical protein
VFFIVVCWGAGRESAADPFHYFEFVPHRTFAEFGLLWELTLLDEPKDGGRTEAGEF